VGLAAGLDPRRLLAHEGEVVALAAAVERRVQTGIVGGSLRLGRMTTVPDLIPSCRGAKGNVDLPLCARGQASTSDHPCVHTG
jgi:hypothetical protein